jgi:hypothetical protein
MTFAQSYAFLRHRHDVRSRPRRFAGSAAALDAAQGEVLLSVTGAVTETNAGDAAEFDLAMLEGFEAVEIETTTIWTEGVQTFVGVELDDLLAAIGAEGETLRAIAANDYAVDIPVADAVDGGPIIAYLPQRRGHEPAGEGSALGRVSVRQLAGVSKRADLFP